MADPERTAFIHTLQSIIPFIKAVESDFNNNTLHHPAQVNGVNKRFQTMLNSVADDGDVGLLLSQRTRGLQGSILEIGSAVQEKVEKSIDFSTREADEIGSFFRQSDALVKNSLDFLRTDNPVLLRWLESKQQEYKKNYQECSAFHEERLIEGICTHTSSIYLDLLHGFKGTNSQTTSIIWLLSGLCGLSEVSHLS